MKNTKSNKGERNKIIENNVDNYTQNSFWHTVGEQIGVCNIYNLNKFVKVDISSNKDIYARAHVANCEKSCEAKKYPSDFKRESYWNLIDRKIPVINSETKQLNGLMKQHTKQRMLFRKTYTNYALELTIDKLFDRFKSMKNRIKAVEKAIKNGWINIGGETKNKYRRSDKTNRIFYRRRTVSYDLW